MGLMDTASNTARNDSPGIPEPGSYGDISVSKEPKASASKVVVTPPVAPEPLK